MILNKKKIHIMMKTMLNKKNTHPFNIKTSKDNIAEFNEKYLHIFVKK